MKKTFILAIIAILLCAPAWAAGKTIKNAPGGKRTAAQLTNTMAIPLDAGTADYWTDLAEHYLWIKAQTDALYQPLDTDLTYLAGVTLSNDIKTFLGAASAALAASALGLGTSDNPSFNSVHASGGNLAAANRQVVKAWQTGLPYVANLTAVVYGGKIYVCTSSHTSGSTTEPGVGADWETVWAEVQGSGSMTYPGSGIPLSTGSAWGTSLSSSTAQHYLRRNAANDGYEFGALPAYPTQSSLSVDDLISLSGVADGSVNLGEFTGTTIADNQTIKASLQALETALEGLEVGGLSDLDDLPGDTTDDNLIDVGLIADLGPMIHGKTGKTTPVDADELPLSDSAATNVLKKLTWANLKATLKTYFDTVYTASTGTPSTSFQIDNDANGPQWKWDSGNTRLMLRNSADNAYYDLIIKNLYVENINSTKADGEYLANFDNTIDITFTPVVGDFWSRTTGGASVQWFHDGTAPRKVLNAGSSAADFPTLNQNTTGTAANISGTPALPNGTSATTQTADDNTTKLATTAFVATGLSGKAPVSTETLTDGAIPAFDGTAGKLKNATEINLVAIYLQQLAAASLPGTYTTGQIIHETTNDTLRITNAAATAYLLFAPVDDTATNGNIYRTWSVDKIYDELALKAGLPSDIAYDASTWDGNTDAPTKNAVRDKIEGLGIPSAATASDINAGTETGKYVTPDALAGSDFGVQTVAWTQVQYDTAVAVDTAGKFRFVVPATGFGGMNLVDLKAKTTTKGVTGTTDVNLKRVRMGSAIGDSTTRFDITNPSGSIFRYTYDGTGTDPVIADSDTSLRVGDVINIQAQNFTTGNNGNDLAITGVGANYFEITRAGGTAETDKTIGTGSIVPIRYRSMCSTAVTIGDEYVANDETVNTALDDLAENDVIFPIISAVHSGTAPKGLQITATFAKP